MSGGAQNGIPQALGPVPLVRDSLGGRDLAGTRNAANWHAKGEAHERSCRIRDGVGGGELAYRQKVNGTRQEALKIETLLYDWVGPTS
jgi:hypothetical protein